MLRIEDLRLRQDDFDLIVPLLTAERHSVTALIGPSGSGKSTLLAGICGFIEPETGTIAIDGVASGGGVRRDVAMVFQDNNLFPHLTVAQNVGLGIKPALRLSPDEMKLVRDSLARVGLEGLDARKPGALSGGQQSRVAIARLLVQKRPLWLLDEPFAALGPAMRRDMLTLVRDTAIESDASVIVVTHHPEDAQNFAEKVAMVADGRVHQAIETQNFFADIPKEMRAYLGE